MGGPNPLYNSFKLPGLLQSLDLVLLMPDITNPGNWSGGNAPLNNGTAAIIFGEAGQREVIVNSSQSVKGLLFDFAENIGHERKVPVLSQVIGRAG